MGKKPIPWPLMVQLIFHHVIRGTMALSVIWLVWKRYHTKQTQVGRRMSFVESESRWGLTGKVSGSSGVNRVMVWVSGCMWTPGSETHIVSHWGAWVTQCGRCSFGLWGPGSLVFWVLCVISRNVCRRVAVSVLMVKVNLGGKSC